MNFSQYFASCFLLIVIISIGFSSLVKAESLTLEVNAPFIDIHSGPGGEFPIFHVLAKGEIFTVMKQRTNWYKIQTENNKEGWINTASMESSVLTNGSRIQIGSGTFDGYLDRDFELIVQGGVLDSVTAMSLGASWVWTKNLAVEATYTQALGNFADNKIWSVRVRQTFFPNWLVSPYLALGTGEIRTRPRSSVVQAGGEVRKSNHYEVVIGMEYYFTSNLVITAEYRGLLALTDRDEQERLDNWMLGVRVFF